MEQLNQLPCPVLVTDRNGQVLSVNAKLLELIGGDVGQWLQQPMDAMFPLPSRIFLQTHVWPSLFRNDRVQEIKLQVLDKGRCSVPVFVNCQKTLCEGVERYYWVLFVTLDRSRFEAELLQARNRAEATAQALAKSEQSMKAVSQALLIAQEHVRVATESSGVGIWDLDLVSDVLLWDAQCYRLFGLEPAEAMAAYALWAGHLHPEDRLAAEQAFKDSVSSGEDLFIEYRIIWADGSIHHLKSFGRVRFDTAGKAVRMVGTNIDATAAANYAQFLKEARDKAEEASLSKGNFLANMSHEIRTPMNAILGMLNLLQNTELTARQRDYASKTEDAAKSLLGLLNDILDFSKIESGKMTLESEPFRIDRLLRSLSFVLSANVGGKDIEVLYDVDAELPAVVRGDAMRLQQVLINLGGNAVKFTSRGQVVVALRVAHCTQDAVAIEFSVQDSGIGIAPENQEHIFSGFSQAEASTTRRFGGTGLGLAICRRFVEMMGGNIQITSTLGEGSTFAFTLTFPLVHECPPELEIPQRLSPAPRRVLVVDDSPVAGKLTLRMVQSWGWAADWASSGAHALQLIRTELARFQGKFPYQLIYMDWQMPAMDGWETSRRIRQISEECPGSAPLIIMVTAHARDTLAQRSPEEQAMLHGFLVKPMTASMLLDPLTDPSAGTSGLRKLATGRSSQRQLAGMRILVAEDNLINQQVAEELLMAEGALVFLAANGQLCVEAVAAAAPQFDVVLMDIQMPVMDGYGATRVIREQMGLATLPIIAMSANAMASDREACMAAGMNEHVGKPFDMTQLVSLLIRITGFQSDSYPIAPPEGPIPLPASLTEVAVLDMTTALARMSGMHSLYLRAAREFAKVLDTLVADLRPLLHDSSRAKAVMLLHTLKGSAGTLGADALAREAGRLEAMCQVSMGTERCLDDIDGLAGLVESTRLSLGQAINQLEMNFGSAPILRATNVDRQSVLAALSELESLLRASDLAVLLRFAELQPLLSSLPANSIDTLEAALQSLELELAQRVCSDLLDTLTAPT